MVLCRGGKKNWRDAYVNGTPFTIACMAFAAIVFGAVITTAAMIVAGEEDDERHLTSSASKTHLVSSSSGLIAIILCG